MHRARHILWAMRLRQALDPWQRALPPPGLERPGEHPLQQAWLLRLRAQLPADTDQAVELKWLLAASGTLLIGSIWSQRIPALIGLMLALLLVAFICAVLGIVPDFLRRQTRSTWEESYCDAYLGIAQAIPPLTLTGSPAGNPLADELLALTQRIDVHDLPSPWSKLSKLRDAGRRFQWNTRVRARYAALYDYFFFPQQQFHELLESTQPAPPALS